MQLDQQKIYQLASIAITPWPISLIKDLSPHWQKTLTDDKNGFISLLPTKILSLTQTTITNKKYSRQLGAANLYLWTAANLQDDLSDEINTPKEYLPLANACLRTAWHLSLTKTVSTTARLAWEKLMLSADQANWQESKHPQKPNNNKLSAANKSSFLLSSAVLLIARLDWRQAEQDLLIKAFKYLLAAKQWADDVYDYRDDWLADKRNYAHLSLTKLPTTQELPVYYQKQAHIILNLCGQSRRTLKKIPVLKNQDCFDDYLKPLEANCYRALANLKFPADPTDRHPKK